MQRRRSAPVSSVLSRNTFRMKDTLRIMDLHDAGEASCSAPKAMRHVDSSHTVMDALVDSSIESKVDTPANTDLIGLPADIILFIGERCAEADILALTLACHALHETVEASSSLWEAKIRRRHASVIDSSLVASCRLHSRVALGRPTPTNLIENGSTTRQRSGRLLLRMSSNCALCRPHDDVDPMTPACLLLRDPTGTIFTFRFVCLADPARPLWVERRRPLRCLDATDFVDRHPGAEYLYQAGSEMDCTQALMRPTIRACPKDPA